jgi:hypothetical protein
MSAPKLDALEALLIDGWKREILRITLDNDQELICQLLRCEQLAQYDILGRAG